MSETNEINDKALALKIAVDSLSSCTNHDAPSMLNPTETYMYANNPGFHSCSSVDFKKSLKQESSFVPCIFIEDAVSVNQQSKCPYYTPDYFIVLKATFSDSSLSYYLTRFKSILGHYFYKIYNSESVVLFNLSYVDLSNSDQSVDQESKKVFLELINSFDSEYQISTFLQPSVEKKDKNSYISSLVS
jgi:hypothetical protein